MNPRISIVIPSFNQGRYLEQTITSIIEQDYDNYEIIIIDAGSTDDTVEVIRKYERYIHYWVSEADNGQADAINKGLNHVTGEIFNWINSDDYLEPGALSAIANGFNDPSAPHVVCGYTRCFFDDDNSTSHEYRMGRKDTVADTIVNVEMNQPGTFYRTSIVKALGGVNSSLRYVFDDELWFRYLCKCGFDCVKFIDERIAQFRLHRTSKSVGEGFDAFNAELNDIHYYIACQLNFPEWLVRRMNIGGTKYENQHRWDFKKLESQKLLAWFSLKYAHDAFQHGLRKETKKSMRLALKHGYFNWSRMQTSLLLKTMFA